MEAVWPKVAVARKMLVISKQIFFIGSNRFVKTGKIAEGRGLIVLYYQ
jgi:hypothetical protein